MTRIHPILLVSWLAACSTPETDPCAAQLEPEVRAYVCQAGLNTPLADVDALDRCFVPACEAVARDNPQAYVDLLQGASEASSMTTSVITNADVPTTDAFIVALSAADPIVQRNAIEGVGHAGRNENTAVRLAPYIPHLVAMVTNDKAQAPDELDRSLDALGALHGRLALLTALAVAFDPAFTVETRERAATYLKYGSIVLRTTLEPSDYAAQRAIFEAATTAEGRALLPPNEPDHALTIEEARIQNDRVLQLMARALATAPEAKP